MSVVEHPAEGITLDIAPQPKEAEPRGRRKLARNVATRLRRWRQRHKLRALLRAAPYQSQLRDYVFLSFMSGRRRRRSPSSCPKRSAACSTRKGNPSSVCAPHLRSSSPRYCRSPAGRR
jgi:hypothetical protein